MAPIGEREGVWDKKRIPAKKERGEMTIGSPQAQAFSPYPNRITRSCKSPHLSFGRTLEVEGFEVEKHRFEKPGIFKTNVSDI